METIDASINGLPMFNQLDRLDRLEPDDKTTLRLTQFPGPIVGRTRKVGNRYPSWSGHAESVKCQGVNDGNSKPSLGKSICKVSEAIGASKFDEVVDP